MKTRYTITVPKRFKTEYVKSNLEIIWRDISSEQPQI